MPRQRRTECKVDGCTNPPYVFPCGASLPYCHKHAGHRQTKTRAGLEPITGPMMDVLLYLRAEHQGAGSLTDLSAFKLHANLMRSLIKREWIYEAKTAKGLRYGLTARGLKALKVYEPVLPRRDGMCARCSERPRRTRQNGKVDNYCFECVQLIRRERRAENRDLGNPDRPCSQCKKRPRHVYPGGKLCSYCEHCAAIRRRKSARKKRADELKSVKAGGPIPLCHTCKEKPCVVYAHSISTDCVDCGRVHRKRRRLNKVLSISGVSPKGAN